LRVKKTILTREKLKSLSAGFKLEKSIGVAMTFNWEPRCLYLASKLYLYVNLNPKPVANYMSYAGTTATQSYDWIAIKPQILSNSQFYQNAELVKLVKIIDL
jgi:hypothetical protein